MTHEQFTTVKPYTYIDFQKKGERKLVNETKDMGNVLIDYAADGTVVGIELLVPGKMCGCWNNDREED